MSDVPESPTAPLATKLGVVTGSKVTLLHAPAGFVFDVAPDVKVGRRAKGASDVVVAFFTSARQLEEQVAAMARMVFPAGGLWIAWPKKASGVATDISDHVVRDVALPLNLVDNKVCALDETWTALRLVWRRDARG